MLTGFEPDAAETQEILVLLEAVSAPLPVPAPLGGEPATTFDPHADRPGS